MAAPSPSDRPAVSARTPARRLDLDVCRGIAILLAMGWHFNTRDTGIAPVDWLQQPGRAIGWAGVDLFFVLSGYLVGGLIFAEVMRSGAFDGKRFLTRRLFKLWPVLYAYIFLLIATRRYEWWQILPQTLLHVQNYFLTPLAHLWSLAVEEHFYLLFVLGFAICQWYVYKNRRDLFSTLSTKAPAVIVAIMLAAAALRCWAVIAGVQTHSIQVQTQFRIDALACGVGLAHIRAFRPALFHVLAQRKLLWFGCTALGVWALCAIGSDQTLKSTVGYLIAYASAASCLLWTHDLRWITGTNPLVLLLAWLGRFSYAMYVFQFVGVRAVESAWAHWTPYKMSNAVSLVVSYLGAITVAYLVTKLIEQPSLRLRDRLLRPAPCRNGNDVSTPV